MKERLIPTGFCWCGCGRATTLGSFFVKGHDVKALRSVIRDNYGDVPAFLVAHGRDPRRTT